MKHVWIRKKRSLSWLGGGILLVVILVILASFIVSRNATKFSGASSMIVAADHSSQPPSVSQLTTHKAAALAPNYSGDSSALTQQENSGATGPETQSNNSGSQDLVKKLNVDLQVKDTRKVADSLQAWITTTDAHASSSGTDYEQVGDKLYNISLTFSVQAALYPQVYRYLRDYTTQNGGHLVTFNESIQDITNTYVDTQSRLQNLRVEQGRLQDLLSHAQALGDILAIDRQLTDVEGQIESDEARFKALTSQVTFYTVSISLEPLNTVIPSSSPNGWSVSQIMHDAFSASLAFGQGVIALLIWLLAFGLYIIPFAIIIWLLRKWYIGTRQVSVLKGATEASAALGE